MTKQYFMKWISLCLCVMLFIIVQLFANHKSKLNSDIPVISRGQLGIKMEGRLGNLMFQYASILGLGDTMHFRNIVIDGGKDLLSSFQLHDNRVQFSSIKLEGNVVKELHCCAFDKRLTLFNNTAVVQVKGYLLSWKYFYNIEKHIKTEFTFAPSILSNAKRIKLDIASQFNDSSGIKSTYIGVHVRRGDFIEKSKVEFGHLSVTKHYIVRAINMYTQMFGDDIIFIFCSDDIKWVKDNFSNNTHSWKMAFVEGNPPAVDMAVLSLCDHTIVTTGTFGWWAAWLAGGKTIISKQQFVNGSQLSKQLIYQDFFPPEWIAID